MRAISFIKSIFSTTVVFITSMIIFFLVIMLYGINLEVYYVAFYSCLFIYCLYLIIEFFIYKKMINRQKIIDDLRIENSRLNEDFIEFKNSIIGYFMMWIHQIKTPITSSFLIIESMEESQEKKLLNTSLFSIDRYTNMVLDYLKLMEKDKNLDISLVDLDLVVTDILKKYSFLFINNGISLKYTTMSKSIVSDYKWLSILVEQIISNSIKYTKNGSISIFFDDEKNALVVKDTGIGIREEDIPRIFDRGFSGFNGRLNKQSSGIGLYIVKKISDKINVGIDVKSKIGEGTSFYIIFKRN